MWEADKEARRWLRQAENDLELTRLVAREGFSAQACFHAQQTAEKALKAIAYAGGERVVLGHSVVELLDRFAPSPAARTELAEAAGVLDQYYVATRYPNGLPGGVPFEAFTAAQAEEAVRLATSFVELARRSVGSE